MFLPTHLLVSRSRPTQFQLLQSPKGFLWPESQKILELLAGAILAGLLFNWLQVPVGWLVGPMIVGIIYAIIQGRPQPLPPTLATVGQAVIAIATAAGFDWDTLATAATYAIPLMLCILLTGGMSLFNGYLLSRWAGIERRTGFLGCLPGAGPSIVALSEEIGADALAVAVLQDLRILMVTAIVPTLASLFFSPDSTPQVGTTIPTESHLPMPVFFSLLVLAAFGGLGIWVGRTLNLPSSVFLGPFLTGLVAFWMLPDQLQVPQSVFTVGLLLVGLSIGLKFDWQTFRLLLKAVVIEVALVIGLILICLGLGYGFSASTHVELLAAVLGSTPGGISTMIASATQLGGDSGLVLAMQMTRMLLILLISPPLAAFLMKSNPPEGVNGHPKAPSAQIRLNPYT